MTDGMEWMGEAAPAGMGADGGAALAALLGSRMCHDLASPLGAVGNGLELLEMAGGNGAAERALMADSVAAARARLRLFQLAFGRSGADQRLPLAELREVLCGSDALARLAIVLDGGGDLARGDAKLITLGVMCMATALPWGGRVLICRAATRAAAGVASGWRLVAEADRTRADPGLWSWLDDPDPARPLPSPAEVHFPLIGAEARAQSRRLQWEVDATGAEISL